MKKSIWIYKLTPERMEFSLESPRDNDAVVPGSNGEEKRYNIEERSGARKFAQEISNKNTVEAKDTLKVNIVDGNKLTEAERQAKVKFLEENIKKEGVRGSKEEYDKILKGYGNSPNKVNDPSPFTVVKWKLEDVFGQILGDKDLKNTYNDIVETGTITKEQNQTLFLIGLYQILSTDYQNKAKEKYKDDLDSNLGYQGNNIDYSLVDLSAGPAFFESLSRETQSLKELKDGIKVSDNIGTSNNTTTSPTEKPANSTNQEGTTASKGNETIENKQSPSNTQTQSTETTTTTTPEKSADATKEAPAESKTQSGDVETPSTDSGKKTEITNSITPIDKKVLDVNSAYNTIIMADYITGELLPTLQKTDIRGKKDKIAFEKGINAISNTIDTYKQNLDYAGLDAFIKNIAFNFKNLGRGDRFFEGVNDKGVLQTSDRKLEKNDAKVMRAAMEDFNKNYAEKQKDLSNFDKIPDIKIESQSATHLSEYNKLRDNLSASQNKILQKKSEIIKLSREYDIISKNLNTSQADLDQLNTNSQTDNTSKKKALEDNINILKDQKIKNLAARSKLYEEIDTLQLDQSSSTDITKARSDYNTSIQSDITQIHTQAKDMLTDLSKDEESKDDMVKDVKEKKTSDKAGFEKELKNIEKDIQDELNDTDIDREKDRLATLQSQRSTSIDNYLTTQKQLNTLENTKYIGDKRKLEIKKSVIDQERGKIDEVTSSFKTQISSAEKDISSLEKTKNQFETQRRDIQQLTTEGRNIDTDADGKADMSPFDIDKEIQDITAQITSKGQEVTNAKKQLSIFEDKSDQLATESKNMTEYISLITLEQKIDLVNQEMRLYLSPEDKNIGFIPQTKAQIDQIDQKITTIQGDITKNESLRNQEETTAKKQQINSDISKLTAEKTGLENAKKTFEDNLTKYQTEYDILENQSKILRGEIQEIDPDGKKREDMRKEVSSITPQSIGMREINTKELYNNIA